MKQASAADKLSTLSTVLLTNLDETVFFSKISEHIATLFDEYKVSTFIVQEDESTRLIAENGKPVSESVQYKKGEGLSGYVVRLKRAYYSNSSRDPLLVSSLRDDLVKKELAVPITVDNNVIGTIHVQSSNEDRIFSEEDILIIVEVLSKLSPAVNNMKMYLMAKNLNKKLQEKIKEKEEQLVNKASITSTSRVNSSEEIKFIGRSNEILDVLTMAEKVAKEDFPIMIHGESGTGRKLLAKKVHAMSPRSGQQFIIAHCEAIEDYKFEVELFGTQDLPGLFEQANNGTLILDNVQCLPKNIQAKILRTILSGEIFNVDSNAPKKVNVRIISIAGAQMEKYIEEGSFREDLLYRLNIINMNMPSLRERQGDIKLLAEHFLNKGKDEQEFKVLTNNAVQKLNQYNWPGNLQELRNLMERTYILSDGKYIEEEDLPALVNTQIEPEAEVKDFKEMPLSLLEQEHICSTLDHLKGNKTRAAKSLGITVKTLYNKLHSYGLITPKSV